VASSAITALVLGILRLFVDLFLPTTKETAHVVSDPAAPDPARLARPDRLRAFGDRAPGGVGADGDAGADRG
jgi:hypothetical protein